MLLTLSKPSSPFVLETKTFLPWGSADPCPPHPLIILIITIINNPYIYRGLCSSKCFPCMLSYLSFIMTVLRGTWAGATLGSTVRALAQDHMEEMSWLWDQHPGRQLLSWHLLCLIQAVMSQAHPRKSFWPRQSRGQFDSNTTPEAWVHV